MSPSHPDLAALSTHLHSFHSWLIELGMTTNTAGQYSRAAERWISYLGSSKEKTPALAWREWCATPSAKRLAGYACRQLAHFADDVLRLKIDLGLPRLLPPNSTPAPAPLTLGVQRAMARAAKSVLGESASFRVWLAFLLETGCRRSETMVDWQNFDFEAATVTVLGKGARERTLPLSGHLLRLLRWHRLQSSLPWGGRKADTLYRQYKRCARSLGLDLSVHQTRSTCITRLVLTPGFNILDVGGYTGHIDPASSLRWYYKTPLSRLRQMLVASTISER